MRVDMSYCVVKQLRQSVRVYTQIRAVLHIKAIAILGRGEELYHEPPVFFTTYELTNNSHTNLYSAPRSINIYRCRQFLSAEQRK